MRTEREGGIHQRIDRAHDARAVRRSHHQIREQLQVPRTLLDADDTGHFLHDLHQELRREICPGHDVVDDNG